MNKKNGSSKVVTPFDWQQYTAPAAASTGAKGKRKATGQREKKKLTVGERVERILAHRWGNPYCKPGVA